MNVLTRCLCSPETLSHKVVGVSEKGAMLEFMQMQWRRQDLWSISIIPGNIGGH